MTILTCQDQRSYSAEPGYVSDICPERVSGTLDGSSEADVKAFWRRLCNEVIIEEVNKRLEKIRAN